MDPDPRREARPHRPAPLPDLTGLIDAAGGVTPSSRAEVAAATAAVLVQAGRDTPAEHHDDDRFVALADRVGLETLAALWQGSDPVSLPGALWVLYLLRQWFRSNGEQVRRLWASGAPFAPADVVVAGVAEPCDEQALGAVADAILSGVYRGELDVALERAAAVFRVVAAGRRELADRADVVDVVDVAGAAHHDRPIGIVGQPDLGSPAWRNERVAEDLAAAARRWRAGTLG